MAKTSPKVPETTAMIAGLSHRAGLRAALTLSPDHQVSLVFFYEISILKWGGGGGNASPKS